MKYGSLRVWISLWAFSCFFLGCIEEISFYNNEQIAFPANLSTWGNEWMEEQLVNLQGAGYLTLVAYVQFLQ